MADRHPARPAVRGGSDGQAVALHDLPSPVSGFTVGSYVVITPVLGLILLGAKISGRVWVAVALALAAMTAFTLLRGMEGGDISLPALVTTLLSAVLYSGHTLLLGNSALARQEAYAVTVIQLGTIALMTGVLAAPDGLTLPATAGDWAILGHLSIVACALGFLARSFGQVHVPPVPAAVILSAQPLWVTALAVAVYGEPLTWTLFLGGGLIAFAMLLVVLPGRLQISSSGERPSSAAVAVRTYSAMRARVSTRLCTVTWVDSPSMSEMIRQVEPSESAQVKAPALTPSSMIARRACFQRMSILRHISSRSALRIDSAQASIHRAHALDLPVGG